MTEPRQAAPSRQRDGWVTIGMLISATSAALSSFDGLRSLALAAGWSAWMAPLLPLTLDAFAATATRVWLTASTQSTRARRFARNCAVGAIVLSLIGNAVWHLIAAGLLPVTWHAVMAVGAVPPCILGLVTHLAVLRRQVGLVVPDVVGIDRGAAVTDPGTKRPSLDTTPRPGGGLTARKAGPETTRPAASRPRYRNEAEVHAAARRADAAYHLENGRTITRDALRQALGVSGTRATAVLKQLRAERDTPSG